MKSPNEITLIIGNGFDLDLGLKTTYKDFYESLDWPFPKKNLANTTLVQHVDSQCPSNWNNIEDALETYGHNVSGINQEFLRAERVAYEALCVALRNYIRKQEKEPIDENSFACQLVKMFKRTTLLNSIYSFNYTNMSWIFAKAGFENSVPIFHVHGNCRSDIILVVSDANEINYEFEYLYKTSNPSYSSVNLRYALQRSKLVIFFGHSLGRQDYYYFEDFFKQQCRKDMVENDKRYIFFVTRGQESQFELIRQLRSMNIDINRLFDCNLLKFILTKDVREKNLRLLENIIKNLSHDQYVHSLQYLDDMLERCVNKLDEGK